MSLERLGPEVSAEPGDERIDAAGSNLVYAASGSVVDTTVVGGRVLMMRDGRVEGAAEVVAQAAERARGLGIG